MKRSEGKKKLFNKSFRTFYKVQIGNNPSGFITSFFYGYSSPKYNNLEKSGYHIKFENNKPIISVVVQLTKYDMPQKVEIPYKEGEILNIEVIQDLNNKKVIIKNNGNIIKEFNDIFPWNDHDNGDWVIGCFDYQEGPGQTISNRLQNTQILKYGYEIL